MRGMCHTRDVLMCGNLCGIQIARRKESIFPEPEDVKDFSPTKSPDQEKKRKNGVGSGCPTSTSLHARTRRCAWMVNLL